jgi:hypothetical protein
MLYLNVIIITFKRFKKNDIKNRTTNKYLRCIFKNLPEFARGLFFAVIC